MGQQTPPHRTASSDPACSGGAAEKPVDLVHLARHTLGDPDLEREVLQLFMTQSKVYLRRLKEAQTDRSWRDAAHTIKGSARGIGAWGVAAKAESAERIGFDPEFDTRRLAIAAIESEIDIASQYIRVLFTEH